MLSKTMLPFEVANKLWRYDPETGQLFWKVSRGKAKAGSEAGSVGEGGYISVMYNGRKFYANRLAWLLHYGEEPGPVVHHKDDCKWNNGIKNLVSTTYTVNNIAIEPQPNKTGYRGVRQEPSGRFVAVKQGQYLGVFDTAEQAANRWAKEHWND